MAIIYDHTSFQRLTGNSDISKGLDDAVSQFVGQMDRFTGIDDVVFKHVDYGEKTTVYLRRSQGGYLVSLEAEDFTLEEA